MERYGDPVLAEVLVALGECELFVPALQADFHGPKPVNAIVVVLIALSVLWRRRAPLGALIVYMLPVSVWLAVLYGPKSNLPSEPLFALLVLVYSAAVYTRRDRQPMVLAALVALFASEFALLIAGVKGVGNAVSGVAVIALSYLSVGLCAVDTRSPCRYSGGRSSLRLTVSGSLPRRSRGSGIESRASCTT
jgi:hypothetical protein